MMLSPNFSPFPELTTERLLLRKLTVDDAQNVLLLRSDPEAMKYICRPLTKTIEEAKAWIQQITDALEKNEGITWCICFKEDPQNQIGSIGYWRLEKEHHRAEIGYMLQPSFHGKGIMYEAMEAVLDYGFGPMQLHSVEAQLDPGNNASVALLLKAGFISEGLFKENYFYEGKFLDTGVYSKLTPLKNEM